MDSINDIFNGWEDSSGEHDKNVKVLEKWFETYYEQVCEDAIVNEDLDSLEFLQQLDTYFASIRYFSQIGNHDRVVMELSNLAKVVKPWLE